MRTIGIGTIGAYLLSACSGDARGMEEGAETADAFDSGVEQDGGLGEDEGKSDAGPRLDVGQGASGEGGSGPGDSGGSSCTIFDDVDGTKACERQSPPDAFEPVIQWEFLAPEAPYTLTLPLVANLTDDNGDGMIDLCDKPDIIVVGYNDINRTTGELYGGTLYALDGDTGALHFRVNGIDAETTPAVGDIDGDGLVEVVTTVQGGRIAALEHDGTSAWVGERWQEYRKGAIALADIDADGDVEILAGSKVFDHEGSELWRAPAVYAGTTWAGSTTTAADLTGDGQLEVVFGPVAYRADGTDLFVTWDVGPGFAHVANLDDDDDPEILVTNWWGISVLEHDGAIKFKDANPTGQEGGPPNPRQLAYSPTWMRPGTVHDFDGDGVPEFAMSSGNKYSVFEQDMTVLWSVNVKDGSGIATGTAFDFLGDGVAEAMYGDEVESLIFDGKTGDKLLTTSRTSRTLIEYPVVADVDNDGSAEIVVTSSDNINDGQPSAGFTVKVVRDKDDRWIQARRIWNQHTYHVTNVNEDGTIPQHERPHWKSLNTFRTNAQIENGGVCRPPPAG